MGKWGLVVIELFQRYILLSIHNSDCLTNVNVSVVIELFQRYNLKAIYNTNCPAASQILLLSVFQRYNLKAIYNKTPFGIILFKLLSVFQRYNLKAIYNTRLEDLPHRCVVISIPKIQSESYLQPRAAHLVLRHRCYQYSKDTIWKLFTTGLTNHSVF